MCPSLEALSWATGTVAPWHTAQELRVESWTELHERLFEDTWREQLGRHRSNVAFRGRRAPMRASRRACSASASRLGSRGR